MVSIATWNINSVRLRMDQVGRFLREQGPDVLCLQEIKTVEETFPHQAFEDLGYTYRAVHGQKGYHGVATVSRIPLREFSRHDWQANGEARHVSNIDYATKNPRSGGIGPRVPLCVRHARQSS